MGNFQAFVKDIYYQTGLVPVLDYMLFQVAFFRNRKKNLAFRKSNPALAIPPDYFLYETYRLDYEQFFKDAEIAAREIVSWTEGYIHRKSSRILDWGCGVSRIAMHIDAYTDATTSVHACDINARMIEFNRSHYKNISYSVIPYTPPTSYADSSFNLIYSLSVFTHIEASLQQLWIREIHRIMQDEGVFLFTTHGRFYHSKLLQSEKQLLDQHGVFTKSYHQKGHRMMSTYNQAEAFRVRLQPYFEVLEFHDGSNDRTKTGGQDLWIVRKLPHT